MLGFAPASLHPTYELLIYREIASVAVAPSQWRIYRHRESIVIASLRSDLPAGSPLPHDYCSSSCVSVKVLFVGI